MAGKNIIQRFIDLGITPGMEASLTIRIRLFNVFNLGCMLISLIYAFINSGIHNVASLINLGAILVTLTNYIFIFSKRYHLAFFSLLLLNSLTGIAFVILFGKYIAAELLFCIGLVYSITMFNRWERIGFGVSINIILYIISLYLYETSEPYFQDIKAITAAFYYPNSALFLIALFGLVYLLKKESQQYEKELFHMNLDLNKSYEKNEQLLHQMLPKHVADELKIKGEVEPKIHHNVTVMFTDFFEFTKTAEKLTAIKLVNELDQYFTIFDRIIEKYDLEKLKTIGDAYMCVSGLPDKNDDHALLMIRAAIEIRDAVEEMYDIRTKKGKEAWHIRIGIHSGTVVAGIIGESKFAYDIWGDTVNTAARMESSSEPGKINISETTYTLVSEKINAVYRGKIEAKNKGELNMYFVESLK